MYISCEDISLKAVILPVFAEKLEAFNLLKPGRKKT